MTPVSLADIWLPILVAGLATHVLSTLAWTVLPHHRSEWGHLGFGPIDDAAKSLGAQPDGQYVLTADPNCKDPSKARGMLIYWPHEPSMGANIGMTLAFFMAAAFTIGYLATIGLHKETPLVDVFRFTATAGVLTHVAAGVPHLIWFRRKWLLDSLDGLAYALATGAAFAWLWPN
ncbi:hypothetical protein Pla108_23930 [Botrimarina colliarenosi]|uniref:DUF1761 domain-containing protein n=1 Tax=Botrimarina colliarenosi TaxID=2528001 RepID=A0A5C6A9G5_9BACT|nr:hypothetical protein [Botrimarina colliarenosi]TWT96624.1 hypothetical protein Pla108_23930 [Botrimarina colliarenosi]